MGLVLQAWDVPTMADGAILVQFSIDTTIDETQIWEHDIPPSRSWRYEVSVCSNVFDAIYGIYD